MRVEGNYLIFSSGRKVRVDGAIIGLSLDSVISQGNLIIEEMPYLLNEQEKYELSLYMIERWEGVRDKLWARHEEEMRAEPVETKYPIPAGKITTMDGPFKGGHGLEEMKGGVGKLLEETKLPIWDGPPHRCRCLYITREHTADLVLASENTAASNTEELGATRVWEEGDPKGYYLCPCCAKVTNSAWALFRDIPSDGKWSSQWQCCHCKEWQEIPTKEDTV
jgi:hypothetical protein